MNISRTRFITGPLALFDFFISSAALLFPQFYITVMHTGGMNGNYFMLYRTGVLWFVYAVCQTVAFMNPQRFHLFVLIVAAFRLIEVPADPVYLITTFHTLTPFGKFGLVFAPVFNLVAGLLLLSAWKSYARGKT